MLYIFMTIIFGTPPISFIWFSYNIYKFFKAPKGSDDRKERSHNLISSGTTFGVSTLILVSLLYLANLVVLNM